ncbi:hypothetical protein PSPO01_07900 [Paraphaeosphaeria sporulosa]
MIPPNRLGRHRHTVSSEAAATRPPYPSRPSNRREKLKPSHWPQHNKHTHTTRFALASLRTCDSGTPSSEVPSDTMVELPQRRADLHDRRVVAERSNASTSSPASSRLQYHARTSDTAPSPTPDPPSFASPHQDQYVVRPRYTQRHSYLGIRGASQVEWVPSFLPDFISRNGIRWWPQYQKAEGEDSSACCVSDPVFIARNGHLEYEDERSGSGGFARSRLDTAQRKHGEQRLAKAKTLRSQARIARGNSADGTGSHKHSHTPADIT